MSTPDRACPDYPNECVHPWAHARTYAEVQATQDVGSRPVTAPNRPERIEIVKRELNQGALAGLGSEVTDYAAQLVIAALDSYDQHVLATERARIKRSMSLAILAALRSIPDGEIRNGCVVHDGGQVRERLRSAWLSITDPPVPTTPETP